MNKSKSVNEYKESLIASEIIYAIRHSQYQILALYIRHNYNLNKISKDHRNALFYALDINKPSKRGRMIKYCLNHGINPLQKDKDGYTVLHEAIARQQIDSFQLILSEVNGEIDWRSLDKQGRTILHQAVESNNRTILEDLIKIMNHYNISVDDLVDKNGLTPYLLAVKLHLHDMAEILLKQGHASRQKCDSQTHRSAREWENIGLKENHLVLRKQLRQEINDAMRNGKLTKANKLKQVYFPLSPLSTVENQRRNSYLTVTTRSGLNTKSTLSIDQFSEDDKLELSSKGQLGKQTFHYGHLPPISTSTLSQHRTDSSFNSLINLLQIAQILS
jgi:ankyrin repeat protein